MGSPLLLSLLVVAIRSFAQAATSTQIWQHGLDPTGWSPKPTQAPNVLHNALFKRDIATLCGYVNGDPDSYWDCDVACGLTDDPPAIGCCSNITSSGGSTIAYNCKALSTCLDYSQGCDANCQTNTNVWACTDTSSPYCGTYVYSDYYSNFDCFETQPTGIFTLLDTTTEANSSVVAATTSTSEGDGASPTSSGSPTTENTIFETVSSTSSSSSESSREVTQAAEPTSSTSSSTSSATPTTSAPVTMTSAAPAGTVTVTASSEMQVVATAMLGTMAIGAVTCVLAAML